MSSLLVYTQPATCLPDFFVPQKNPDLLRKHLASVPHLSRVTPASQLEVRPAPETVSSGIAEIDVLTGGLPRGCLTEIYGPASSGRTSLLLAAIAAATWRQEACALVDVSDTFDPQSAAAAGVGFKNLLWVRCDATPRRDKKKNSLQKHRGTEESFVHSNTRPTLHGQNRAAENDLATKKNSPRAYDREGHGCGGLAPKENRSPEFTRLEQALKAADLLLESGGFGLVAIDLSDIAVQAIGRIPLTSWFRFRRAIENTPTVLLVFAQGSCARTCASLRLQLEGQPSLIRLSAEPSAFSGQLSKNVASVQDCWRSVGTHNFPNLQNSWISHQGMALATPNLTSSKCRSQSSPLREQSAVRDIGIATHAQLLNGMSITAELRRSRWERKPAQSITAAFTTKAAWTG